MKENYVPLGKTELLSERQLLVLILNALNNQASGGPLGSQTFSGSGAPTGQSPANGAGTYFDYTNSVLYNWNPITGSWV